MKRIILILLLLALVAGAIVPFAFSEGVDKIFLKSEDFPPDAFAQVPPPPIRVTQFWKALDKEMRGTETLQLTETVEDANYRVDLRCAGVVGCTKLKVYIQTPNREPLASYTIGGKPLVGRTKVDKVAHELTQSLSRKIGEIKQGGTGHEE